MAGPEGHISTGWQRRRIWILHRTVLSNHGEPPSVFSGQNTLRQAACGLSFTGTFAQGDLVRSVWTTNFDGFAARTSTDFNLTTIEMGIDCQNRLHRIPSKGNWSALLCTEIIAMTPEEYT